LDLLEACLIGIEKTAEQITGFFLIVMLQFCDRSEKMTVPESEFVSPVEYIGLIYNKGLEDVMKNPDQKKDNKLSIQNVWPSYFMISDENHNLVKYNKLVL
jgi:hypothetical protein